MVAGCGGNAQLTGITARGDAARAVAKEAAEKLPDDAPSGLKAAFVNSVVVMLAHRDADARAEAAEELGELRRKAAAKPLLMALKDTDGRVRATAAEALGKTGEPKAFTPLAYLLQDPIEMDRDPRVRAAAAIALGELPVYEDWDPLGRASRDEDAEVRLAVAGALSARAYHSPALYRLLKEDADHRVRATAAAALGRVGAAADSSKLVSATRDPAPAVRYQAVNALRAHRKAPVRPAITDCLGDPHPMVRMAAIRALVARGRGDPTLVIRLSQRLEDRDTAVRAAAARAMGELGDLEALPYLEQAPEDPSPSVRQAVAEAIRKLRQRLSRAASRPVW